MVTFREAEDWINLLGLTYPVLADVNGEVIPLFLPFFGAYILPHSCIVDDEQTLQYTHMGWEGQTQIDSLITLIATLLIPEIGSSTSEIEFSGVEPGQSDSYEIYIDNTRLGILNVTGASATNDAYSIDFTAGEVYAVDDSMLITVTFAPEEPGNFDDILTITSDAGTLEIPLNAFVGIKEVPANSIPGEFALHGNYPNPFNPETSIEFALPSAARVNLEVYSILGEKVSALDLGEMNPGIQTVNFNAARLTAGVYLYRITAGDFSAVDKMILLK